MIQIERVTQPAVEPVALADALLWVTPTVSAVTGAYDGRDEKVVSDLLSEARELIEDSLRRSLVVTTWKATLDAEDYYDADGNIRQVIYLPVSPLVAVTSVSFTDVEDVTTTVSPSAYYYIAGECGFVGLNDGEEWSEDEPRSHACLVIQFTAGHATAVGPITQTSTNTETVVTGGTLDARTSKSVRYDIKAATKSIIWTVYGSDAADFTGETAAAGPEGISADLWERWTLRQATKSYYRVKIKSQTSGEHGVATLTGLIGAMPGTILIAIRELVTFWYRNRGEGTVTNRISGGNVEVPAQVQKVLERVGYLRVWQGY